MNIKRAYKEADMRLALVILLLVLFAVLVSSVSADAPAVTVSVQSYGDCAYRVEYRLTGLAPNSPVYSSETTNETDCEGEFLGTGWVNWEIGRTDSRGRLTVAVRHTGIGDYALSFQDNQGNRARVLFAYREAGRLLYQTPFLDQPYWFGSLEPEDIGVWVQVNSNQGIRRLAETSAVVVGYPVPQNYYSVVVSSNNWLLLQTDQGRGWIPVEQALTVVASASTPAPSVTPSLACPNTLPATLAVGMRGQVVFDPPLRNRVRRSPGLDSGLITTIAPGTQFSVISGPICADNFRWWEITTDSGITGWTADGNESVYWLEPVSR